MRLVGRDEELAHILRTASSTGGSLTGVWITGEGGIGKSVLLRAAIDQLEKDGWTIAPMRGDALERSIPYAALVRALAPLAGDTAELARMLDVLGSGAPAEVEASFGAVCGGLTDVLQAQLDSAPVAVAIDDVDALGDDTLAAMAIVARRLRTTPLAVLATSRTPAVAGPTRYGSLVEVIETEARLHRVALTALAEGEIGVLVGAVLAVEPDADLVRELHRRTDGNPFFAVEMASSLRDAGQVDPHGQRGARLTSPMRLTRTEAVLRRFTPLDTTGRAVLEAIAVLGRAAPADLELVAEIAGVDVSTVARVFDDVVARGILQPAGEAYAFVHDLVREAVYDAVGPARQRLLHAAIAQRLLADRAAGRAADLLSLARHVSASAVPGDAAAARVLADAGDLSRGIAPVAAAASYRRALELAPADDPSRPSLLARQSRALSLANLPAEAVAAGRLALESLTDSDERVRTANVVISAMTELGDLDGALTVVEAEVARSPESPVLAAQRAWVLWNLQRFELSLAEAERANALPTTSAAERLLTLGPLGIMAACAGVPRPLPEHSAEILRLSTKLPPTLELYGTAVASYGLATSGFLSLSHAPLSRAEALTDEIGGTAFRAQVLTSRVFVDWLEGRWDEAIDAIERSRVEARDAQLAVQAAGLRAIEIEIRSWRGEPVPTDAFGADAPVPNFTDFLAWAAAGHLLTSGRLDEARALLANVGERNAFEIAYRPILLARRVDIEVAAGDEAAARAFLAELEAEPQRRASAWASVLLLRGRALVERDASAAEQAAEIAADEGLVFERARSQLVAAELAADAAAGLDGAYRTFQALGADALRRRAAELLKARGLKIPRQRATAVGPLSASELKMARLIQQGLRNREIAAVLHLSPRTVEVYLSRIYNKLNVSSRLELARVLDSTTFDG